MACGDGCVVRHRGFCFFSLFFRCCVLLFSVCCVCGDIYIGGGWGFASRFWFYVVDGGVGGVSVCVFFAPFYCASVTNRDCLHKFQT